MTDSKPLVFANVFEVREFLAPLRAQGKTLATTNGCFDIIHAGHVTYLSEAAALADMLVVGINSDSSVKKLKGAGRPLQNEKDRALIVASLKMVTCTFVFPEDDPLAFLRILKPEVHIKGGDYTPDIIEKPVVESYGGRIKIVSFVSDRSTTRIIREMQNGGAA
jgi:rfaE bifunctional protein nucleotidyltransferase chain/domain